MASISTNISTRITTKERSKIKKDYSDIDSDIQFFDYVVNSTKDTTPRFVLSKFKIKEFLDDIKKWDLFKDMIIDLNNIANEKTNILGSQYWINDANKTPPINISFSIKSKDNVQDIFTKLQELLKEKIKEMTTKETNKIIWIGYDIEMKDWKVTIL